RETIGAGRLDRPRGPPHLDGGRPEPTPLPPRRPMRIPLPALLLLLAAPLAAQQPPRVTAEDYARAERFLAPATVPLVTGLGVRPVWLEDGRFWYSTTTAEGSGFFVVDPASPERRALFDRARLSAALAAATGGRVEGVPF